MYTAVSSLYDLEGGVREEGTPITLSFLHKLSLLVGCEEETAVSVLFRFLKKGGRDNTVPSKSF